MENFLIALLIVIIIISVIYSYIKIDISYYEVKNNKIDKDIKILFLSDLHNRNIYNRLDIIIDEEKPDIIICGGDMINEDIKYIDKFMKIIPLFSNYETYYVFGNHEERIKKDKPDHYKKYLSLLEKSNIILLNNKSKKITNNIKIYGLDNNIDTYLNFGKKGLNKKIISNYLGNNKEEEFNILVAHNPLEFDSYVDAKYDLVLSGHIHGGLIIIPFFGGLLSPNYTFFPKYYKGLYKKNKTTMIVSRGLGFSARIKIRLFNNPEVVIINLKKGK